MKLWCWCTTQECLKFRSQVSSLGSSSSSGNSPRLGGSNVGFVKGVLTVGRKVIGRSLVDDGRHGLGVLAVEGYIEACLDVRDAVKEYLEAARVGGEGGVGGEGEELRGLLREADLGIMETKGGWKGGKERVRRGIRDAEIRRGKGE